MDNNTFDQMNVPQKMIGDGVKYLKENMSCYIVRHNGKVIMVEIPTHVELQVVDTPPNDKGNTSSGGSKPATLETGAVVNVPFFIVNGDTIRVETRNNTYLERA
jgi:elongation factor P